MYRIVKNKLYSATCAQQVHVLLKDEQRADCILCVFVVFIAYALFVHTQIVILRVKF
jgi:hypothetical protein